MAARFLAWTLALSTVAITIVFATPLDGQENSNPAPPPLVTPAVAGNDADKIVGGVDAARHEFPFIVSIRSPADDFHFCGGSIMNSEWVLTAAHCITLPINNADYKIVAGAHDFADPDTHEQTVGVDGIWVHPDYDKDTQENDLALLHVTPPFDLDDVTVASIALPSAHHHSQPPDQAVVAGWGTLSSGGPSPSILQKVTVDHVDDDVCVEAYQHVPEAKRGPRPLGGAVRQPITDARIIFLVDPKIEVCYAAPGKDSCQGDSGGPLIDVQPSLARGGGAGGSSHHTHSKPCQVGVVSFGHGCAVPGFAGIYVRLSAFTDWIQYTMATKAP